MKNKYIIGKVSSYDPLDSGDSYIITDCDGIEYRCHFSNILTDGFRFLLIGDKVRFIPDVIEEKRIATYVIKLSELDYDLDSFYE